MRKNLWLLTIHFPKYRTFYRFATQDEAIEYGEGLKDSFSDLWFTVEAKNGDAR